MKVRREGVDSSTVVEVVGEVEVVAFELRTRRSETREERFSLIGINKNSRRRGFLALVNMKTHSSSDVEW